MCNDVTRNGITSRSLKNRSGAELSANAVQNVSAVRVCPCGLSNNFVFSGWGGRSIATRIQTRSDTIDRASQASERVNSEPHVYLNAKGSDVRPRRVLSSTCVARRLRTLFCSLFWDPIRAGITILFIQSHVYQLFFKCGATHESLHERTTF